MSHDDTQLLLHDLQPDQESFLHDVISGLRSYPKRLPCKYFYDERGCQLFDRICELEEYYLTRTELTIMRQYSRQMARRIGPECMLIEFGSGSSVKTRILLDHLISPAAYVPVDIAREHLVTTAGGLCECYPNLNVLPVCADFTLHFELPDSVPACQRRIVYFPGSTIGNLNRSAMQCLMRWITMLVGPHGGLLIGIDLVKDVATLETAYNDQDGVTAEFNVNLLRRINRQLKADFVPEKFEHRAVYNQDEHRIEMSLTSLDEQVVNIGGEEFDFLLGESILTEYSHKYALNDFEATARECGLDLQKTWTDDRKMFGVLYLESV